MPVKLTIPLLLVPTPLAIVGCGGGGENHGRRSPTTTVSPTETLSSKGHPKSPARGKSRRAHGKAMHRRGHRRGRPAPKHSPGRPPAPPRSGRSFSGRHDGAIGPLAVRRRATSPGAFTAASFRLLIVEASSS
jgi:hypothetical protein